MKLAKPIYIRAIFPNLLGGAAVTHLEELPIN